MCWERLGMSWLVHPVPWDENFQELNVAKHTPGHLAWSWGYGFPFLLHIFLHFTHRPPCVAAAKHPCCAQPWPSSVGRCRGVLCCSLVPNQWLWGSHPCACRCERDLPSKTAPCLASGIELSRCVTGLPPRAWVGVYAQPASWSFMDFKLHPKKGICLLQLGTRWISAIYCAMEVIPSLQEQQVGWIRSCIVMEMGRESR